MHVTIRHRKLYISLFLFFLYILNLNVIIKVIKKPEKNPKQTNNSHQMQTDGQTFRHAQMRRQI